MNSVAQLLKWKAAGADRSALPLMAGGAIFIASFVISLLNHSWLNEDAAHSPLILTIGAWLLVRRWGEVSSGRSSGSPALALAVLLPMLFVHVVAQWLDWITLAGYSAWLSLVAVGYVMAGGATMARLWFPLCYLLFALPLPKGTTVVLTQDIRLFLSDYAVRLLDLFGYPVARAGITLYVDRYELLVEEACSGLNSMLSLTAVGLFYAYVKYGSSWRYTILFTLLMIAVAMAANFLRVLLLILITYHFGDAAAQSFIHEAAGVTLFAIALAGMFALDRLLAPVRARMFRSA
ncbi:MAG TPA: exosortase [Allosphingosinicella sp.]|jgi:exosortase